MKCQVPLMDHPLVKVTAKAGQWSAKRYLSRAHRDCEIPIPEGVNQDEVEITAEGCDDVGNPVAPPITIKPARRPSETTEKVSPPTPSRTTKPKSERRKAERQEAKTEDAQDQSKSERPLMVEPAVDHARDSE